LRGKAEGFLYNEHDMSLRKDVLCFLGVQEKLFQSLEGSTAGYYEAQGEVKPRLAQYEYEDDAKLRSCLERLQQGALTFVERYLPVAQERFTKQDYIRSLMRFGKYPDLQGVRLFSFFYIMDGNKAYFVPQKSLIHNCLREFMHDLSNSPWKTGFMRGAFKLPLPYFWLYSLLRR
jgi:hypothetical protein